MSLVPNDIFLASCGVCQFKINVLSSVKSTPNSLQPKPPTKLNRVVRFE